MKVRLETNFGFEWNIPEGERELASDQATIRSLLEEISRNSPEGERLIDPETNEVDTDNYLVMLNGGSWEFLPERLEMKLKEGDRISIIRSIEMLSGG